MWLKNKNAWKNKQNEIKKKEKMNECKKGGAAVLWGCRIVEKKIGHKETELDRFVLQLGRLKWVGLWADPEGMYIRGVGQIFFPF